MPVEERRRNLADYASRRYVLVCPDCPDGWRLRVVGAVDAAVMLRQHRHLSAVAEPDQSHSASTRGTPGLVIGAKPGHDVSQTRWG